MTVTITGIQLMWKVLIAPKRFSSYIGGGRSSIHLDMHIQ